MKITKIINNFFKKTKKKINIFFSLFSRNKKQKKIEAYKKLKKQKNKTIKKEKRGNKYNLQLNLKFKKQHTINIIIFSILIILIIILFIIKSDYFKIKQINIISPDGLSNTYILEKKLNFLKNKLIFNIDKNKIKDEILKIEQNIKKININKNLPDKIKIRVYSYPILFKTLFNGKNYLITENGVFIPSKNDKSKYLELVIKNYKTQNYPDYKKILNENTLKKINYIIKKLQENITNIKINKIIYYKKEKEAHIIINNNTRLIFNLFGDINKQLKQIYVFNKEKIDITKSNFIYIDNRIKYKILYCPLEEKIKCIKNINFIYNEKLKASDYTTKNIKK